MPAGAAFRILIAELARVGLDPARICAEAGVDPAVVSDASLPFGIRKLGRVLARAEEVTGDAHLGLHLAATAPGRGFLSYVFRAQPTIACGLAEMARFASAVWGQDDVVRVARRGADATVSFHVADGVPRHALEFVVARLALGLRQSGALVREIAFRHDGAVPSGEYERVLGVRVRFGRPATTLRIDGAALARPLPTANADAAAALASGLERATPGTGSQAGALGEKAMRAPAGTTTARLSREVEAALAAGAALDRETLARALGMSGKTLARRLAEEQQGFRSVVERARRELALRLVVHGDAALGEVASRAGFADQAAFGKAFRRWFGASPGVLRSRPRGA